MRRFFAAVAILAVSFAVITLAQGRGQRGQRGADPAAPAAAAPAAPAPAPGTPTKPLIPLAASTLAAHPDSYYGEYVSVTGAVESLLTKSAFSVDQDKTKSTGKEVLILVPTIQSPVEANVYVTVLGEVLKFDPAEIAKKAKDYKLDLTPEMIAKYQGKPVIIATSVITPSGLDVAKRLPPPLTAEETEFQKVMRAVGPANTALRGAIDKTDLEATKAQVAILTKAFVQTEAFWKARNKPEAIKFASDAHAMSDAMDKALAIGKWDDVKASAATLGQQCAGCHGAYRERFDDGSFRIKMSSK